MGEASIILEQLGLGERYRVSTVLAEREASLVVVAVDKRTGGRVVVKVGLDSVERRLVDNEAEILRSLGGLPVAPRLYGHVHRHGVSAVIIEYLPYKSLRHAQAMGLMRVLDLVFYAAASLCHIHGKGIVHRDLKPDNLIPVPRRGVVVIDYGIASLAGRPGLPAGTPGYSCPEALEGAEARPGCDMYSFAAIMYFLASGREPPREPETLARAMTGLSLHTSLVEYLYRIVGDPNFRARATCAQLLELLSATKPSLRQPHLILDGAVYILNYGIIPVGEHSNYRLPGRPLYGHIYRRNNIVYYQPLTETTLYRCGKEKPLPLNEWIQLKGTDILVVKDLEGKNHYIHFHDGLATGCTEYGNEVGA